MNQIWSSLVDVIFRGKRGRGGGEAEICFIIVRQVGKVLFSSLFSDYNEWINAKFSRMEFRVWKIELELLSSLLFFIYIACHIIYSSNLIRLNFSSLLINKLGIVIYGEGFSGIATTFLLHCSTSKLFMKSMKPSHVPRISIQECKIYSTVT